jgi:RecJ-like exonuclease
MIQQLIEWMEKEVRSYQGIMESTGNSNQLIALSNKINTIRKAISKAKELQANNPVQKMIQKCPICEGQGHTAKPSYVPAGVDNWSSTSVSHVCHYCNGAKVISVLQATEPCKWAVVEESDIYESENEAKETANEYNQMIFAPNFITVKIIEP